MDRNSWSDVIIENRSTPRKIDESLFHDWMAEQQIFVSSVMDDEMTPARQALRQLILKLGGNPVMWETLAPRDQHPARAYLEGVERSNLFVLLLGEAYGVTDESGFSPTHQEANRAECLHLNRMVFQPEGIKATKRDGRLNNWVRSLYNQISAGTYSSPQDLTDQVERQLRYIASAQETVWIKLGSLVFPGKVESQSTGDHTSLTITARVRQHPVKRRFQELSANRLRGQVLTWGTNSYQVDVIDVRIASRAASEDEVTVVCQSQAGRSGAQWGPAGVTFQTGSRSYTPADQAQLWAEQYVFGQMGQRIENDLYQRLMMGDETKLPDVLRNLRISGWVAEGIVQLFIVEEITSRYLATFQHLRVGPASASGVRAEFEFSVNQYQHEPIHMAGVVPLS